MNIENTRKLIVLSLIIFFNTNLFSQETKCECYSKSGVTEKHGIGAWTSVIGENEEGETLQFHFYAAYFPPQELCIPRDDIWWREVNGAILKAIKTHPIYKSSQVAIKEGHFTANAEQLTGQAFITQSEIDRIKSNPGTIVSVDAYIQEHFASKLQLCNDISNEQNFKGKEENDSQDYNVSKRNSNTDKSTNTKLSDAQNFIDNQNKQLARQEILNQKLANDLTQTFNEISNSWAKERDFQSKISSLTNITSVDAPSIIGEARSKAQQINIEYNRKKDDALNQGVSATQTLINSGQNEKQVIAGGVIGVGLTALSQASLEKERKNAQEKLENEKQQILKKLSQDIIDKFEPLKKQHREAAIYAISKNNEDYHLAQFEYTKCMTDNAYKIVVNNYSCNTPNNLKPVREKQKNLTAQDFLNISKRKFESSSEILEEGAMYFIELAIESEPNNALLLYEKTLIKDLGVYENAAVLGKARSLDTENILIKKAHNAAIKKLKNFIEAERVAIVEFANSNNENIFDWGKHSNLLRCEINNKVVYVNRKGRIIFELEDKYNIVDDSILSYKLEFQYDRLKVQNKITKKYGFLNTKGEIVIPVIYYDATIFTDSEAQIKTSENSDWEFIDLNGEIVRKSFSVYHTVKRKETLFKISKKYNITVEELIRINRISGRINEGQQLKIK